METYEKLQQYIDRPDVFSLPATGGIDWDDFHVLVRISPTYARRLIELAWRTKDLDVYQIELFDYSPDFYRRTCEFEDDQDVRNLRINDPNPPRMDCVVAQVCHDAIRWRAVLKHTDLEVVTDEITVGDLQKIANMEPAV